VLSGIFFLGALYVSFAWERRTVDLDSLVKHSGSIYQVDCPRVEGGRARFYYRLSSGESKEGGFPAIRSLCSESSFSDLISLTADVSYYGNRVVEVFIDEKVYLPMNQGLKNYEFSNRFASLSLCVMGVSFLFQHRRIQRKSKVSTGLDN